MERSSQKSEARERINTLDAEVARRVWRAGVHQTAEPARRQKQAPAGVACVRSDSQQAVDWVRLVWGVELHQRHAIGAFSGVHKMGYP